MHNGSLHRNAEITRKEVSREKVKQLLIPRKSVPVVLNFLHDCATSSHPGKEKAYRQAQLKYYWSDIKKHNTPTQITAMFARKYKGTLAHQHQCLTTQFQKNPGTEFILMR